ncbi:hypothetical protein ACF0H5_022463 [Mactra antiquata]
MELNNLTKEKYVAAMVLGAVGDALGYKNGDWELCTSGKQIHEELSALGGLANVRVQPPLWTVSDDTVMHLATAESLVKHGSDPDNKKLFKLFAEEYKKSMTDMIGRFAGETCKNSCELIDLTVPNGYRLPFNPYGGGCGAAMRSMCIGLRFSRPNDVTKLIEVSIESGRITHHHPTGYLGALATALFASYAVQQKPLREWGAGLLSVINMAKLYVANCSTGFEKENLDQWHHFEKHWQDYLRSRNIDNGRSDPIFPANYDVIKRDLFYKFISYEGFGGGSGYDAPMIAYDALLASGGQWMKVCEHGMFHGGDSDTTGSIAGFLYGVIHGYKDVPDRNYSSVEYRDRLEKVGRELYDLANKNEPGN